MKTWILIFFLGVMSALGGCGPNGAETTPKEPVISVMATKVQRGNVSAYIYTTGTIFPHQEAMINPKISGRIEKLYVDEGDRVTKGEPLAELEQERLQILVKEAEASLQEAQAHLKNIEATWQRNQRLFKEGVVDSQRFDDIATEKDLAKARVQRAQAALEKMQKDLRDSVIRAPFDGFIVEKLMNQGEMATARPPSSIFHLVDTSRVKIECGITEEKKTSVSIGKKAVIVLDAYPGEAFTGNVTTVNPKVDIDSRTFKIKIEIPNHDFRLEAGMFARIRIIERESKDTLFIPQRVIIEQGQTKKVFVVEDGRAKETTITTGIIDHPIVEVTGGLKQGDVIVTEGFYALKNGIKVVVKQLSEQGDSMREPT